MSTKANTKFRPGVLFGEEVTEEEAKERMRICNGCLFKEGRNCGKCGCDLSKKTKWSSESCPIKRW